jgi:hypothetical protein
MFLSLHAWLLIAIPIILRRWRDPGTARAKIIVFCGLLVLAAIYALRGRCLNLLFESWGPGPLGATNLFFAASRGELYNVRTLVSRGVPVDAPWPRPPEKGNYAETALWVASVDGHLDVVKYLVGAGAKIDFQAGMQSSTAQSMPSGGTIPM